MSDVQKGKTMNIIKWFLGFIIKDEYRGYTPAEVEILKRLERGWKK